MAYLFTIYDSTAEKAGNVFMTNTIGEAERSFHDMLKNAQMGSLFSTHPQDFSLRLLGEFDETLVEIRNLTSQEITKGRPPEIPALVTGA